MKKANRKSDSKRANKTHFWEGREEGARKDEVEAERGEDGVEAGKSVEDDDEEAPVEELDLRIEVKN